VSQRGSTSEANTAGSAEAGLQAAVWTRLLILMPLLPLVYADREPKPEQNLRTALVCAIVRWAQCQAEQPACRQRALSAVLQTKVCVILTLCAARQLGACHVCAAQMLAWPQSIIIAGDRRGPAKDNEQVLPSRANQMRAMH